MTQTMQPPPMGRPPALPYASNASAWAPPPGMTEHSGQPIPPGAEFFLPPPNEIGPVRSARTTLSVNKQPRPMVLRLGIGLAITALLVGGFWFLCLLGARPGAGLSSLRPVPLVVVPAGIALVVIGITFYSTRFSHACTYVGQVGVARYTLKGNRGNPPAAEVLLFPQGTELRTRQTRHYTNGVYTGTTYEYNWTDANGRRVFRLNGQHRGGKGLPKPHDPYHFALAAEIAWSQYLLEHVAAQLEQQGFVHFNIKPGQWVRVGPGFLDFCLNQEVQRITTPEIKSINLSGGHFHIAHKDARWFSRRGKFSFDYPNMANARLFLLAVEKLIGYRFG